MSSEQKLVTLSYLGAQLHHFWHSPGSMGSLQEFLNEGWLLAHVEGDDQLQTVVLERSLGETGSPQRFLAAEKSPWGSPDRTEATSTGAKPSEERNRVGGEVTQDPPPDEL